MYFFSKWMTVSTIPKPVDWSHFSDLLYEYSERIGNNNNNDDHNIVIKHTMKRSER